MQKCEEIFEKIEFEYPSRMHALTIPRATYIDVLRLYNTTSWTFPVEKTRNILLSEPITLKSGTIFQTFVHDDKS